MRALFLGFVLWLCSPLAAVAELRDQDRDFVVREVQRGNFEILSQLELDGMAIDFTEADFEQLAYTLYQGDLSPLDDKRLNISNSPRDLVAQGYQQVSFSTHRRHARRTTSSRQDSSNPNYDRLVGSGYRGRFWWEKYRYYGDGVSGL